MKKNIFLILVLVICTSVYGQNKINTIEGYVKNQAEGTVEVYKIEDYLSVKEKKIGSTTIKADSTFELSFFNEETQKVKIKVNNNFFFIYIQPNGDYMLYVKDKSPYNPERPEGNQVEYFFGGLDSTDINFKIIEFEDKMLTFLKDNYRRTDVRAREFLYKLDTFNLKIKEEYANDTSSYFKVYRRYGLASLDDISFIGANNRIQKYDFYLRPYTVFYKNDRYMEYFNSFYDNYHFKLTRTKEQQFYDALLKSSPSLLMHSLANSYEVKNNVRVRELVVIKMLSDLFYSNDYPQTNILNVLDSLSTNALFEENKNIAANIKERLTELKPGSRAPNYLLTVNGEKKTRADYFGKYHYIQFVNTDFKKSMNELELINKLYNKYGGSTKITTVVVDNGDFNLEKLKSKLGIKWDIILVQKDDDIIEQFNINTYPQYVLIDKQGYIVAAPALGPKPNGEYKTIERQLYAISRLRP